MRELEAKNVELERFGYAVTHDLKAPLVTVKGFADHLERDLREGRSDRLEPTLGASARPSTVWQRLVDDLLALLARRPAARAAGGGRGRGARARGACACWRARFGASRVRLELAASLPVVYGDRARLVQVFASLLDDACRFAAAADRVVSVEARPPQDGKAMLVVRDNGSGFDPRDASHVLDPFETAALGSEGAPVSACRGEARAREPRRPRLAGGARHWRRQPRVPDAAPAARGRAGGRPA